MRRRGRDASGQGDHQGWESSDSDDGGDLWDEEIDPEGPSREDLARFGSDTEPCPKCRAEIHSESVRCPRCGEWLDEDPLHGDLARSVRGRGTVLIVVMLVGMLLGLGWCVGRGGTW
jgi:hypothetical protein